MKRLGAVLSLAIIIVTLACPFAYAGGLTLDNITPKDGESGKQPQNMAVKMTFSEGMTNEAARKANANAFKITDAEGKEQKYTLLYDEGKYPNDIWLVMKNDLISNTEYKITIDKDLESNGGNVLGKDITSTFKTRNTATDNKISMGMTVGMMVVMVVASTASAKKMAKQKTEEQAIAREEAMNPYKVAKAKGISVEEAAIYIEKEKTRLEKKRKKAEVDDDDEDDEEEDVDSGAYHVKQRRPISAIGAATPANIVRKNKKKRAAQKLEEERRIAEMKAKSAGKKKKK